MCFTLATVATVVPRGASPEQASILRPPDGASDALSALAAGLPEPGDTATHLGWLRLSIPRAKSSVPQAAVAGLEGLVEALRAAQRLPSEQQEFLTTLIREDVRLKATYCRSHPDGMAALIPLTVRTWAKNGVSVAEAKQWNVVYVSAPLASLGGRNGDPFPQFSSPTSMRLPPGRYVIWAQDPDEGTRRGPAKTVTLGDGSLPIDATVTADLLVPAK